MKSIKSKIMWLTLSAVMITCILIGMTGLVFAANIMNSLATETLNAEGALCSETVLQRCNEIELAGQAIANVIKEEIPEDVLSFANDETELRAFVDKCQDHAISIAAENFDDCIMYLRFNPEIFSPTEGFYVQRLSKDEDFVGLPITDFSKYTSDDIEKVGWYYIPMEKGEGTWMDRYPNPVTGERLLTYVVPIYKNGYPVAVMGMDLDMTVIDNIVDGIELYENGFSFIVDNEGTLLCHSQYGVDYDTRSDRITSSIIKKKIYQAVGETRGTLKVSHKRYTIYCKNIKENLNYVMVVPDSDIFGDLVRLLLYFVGITLFISAVIIILTANIADKIIRRTYTDGLTGLKNKSAYLEEIIQPFQLKKLQDNLALFVLDVNNLKVVNDNQGHEAGDQFLIDAAGLIREIFGKEFTYRIGGDEFVAVVMNCEEKCAKRLVKDFEGKMQEINSASHIYKEKLILALGYTLHQGDEDIEETFARADSLMYENKKMLKMGQVE